jgi:hypothetical protein
MTTRAQAITATVLLVASAAMPACGTQATEAPPRQQTEGLSTIINPEPPPKTCKPPSLCVPVVPHPPVTPPSFTGYCVALVGEENERGPTSATYTETSFEALIDDCYSNAESIILETQELQNCGKTEHVTSCGFVEYLVSDGIAYSAAGYNGAAPSLTDLYKGTVTAPLTNSLSGLCEVTYSYYEAITGTLETVSSNQFVTVSPASDSSLEASCHAAIITTGGPLSWAQNWHNSFDTSYTYFNPRETLTDVSTGSVLVNNVPYVATGDTLTGLCSWSLDLRFPDGEDAFDAVASQTLWDTSDQGLVTQCDTAIYNASLVADGYGIGYPYTVSLVDQTTGDTLFSNHCTSYSTPNCEGPW